MLRLAYTSSAEVITITKPCTAGRTGPEKDGAAGFANVDQLRQDEDFWDKPLEKCARTNRIERK